MSIEQAAIEVRKFGVALNQLKESQKTHKQAMWGLYIKLEAHKEGTFKEFYDYNESISTECIKRLTRTYAKS